MSRCTNAQPGTYNHECGAPATWLATKFDSKHTVNGVFNTTFCDDCRHNGYEAKQYKTFQSLQPDIHYKNIFRFQ